MSGLTKIVLKKPVSTILVILSLVFFGIMSFSLFSYELTPEISMPMHIVYSVYPGASPEDCDKLISKKLEDKCSSLADIKEIDSMAAENMAGVIIQYNYGTDMAKAYDELKKAVDRVANDFDDAIQEPIIMEMDVNSMPSIRMVVEKENVNDLYNYVANDFVPKLEKLSAASQVNTSGGRENYVSVRLKPEELKKYNLTMQGLASILSSADFTYPAGTIDVSDKELSVSTQVEYDSIESFKRIPIITGNKNTIYFEDIADIIYAKKEAKNVGRYDGKDTMIVSVVKKQSSTAVDLSNEVKETINILEKNDPSLHITIVEDDADTIIASLHSVYETMFIAIVLSMIIIYLFFGEIKASLIVGTSIPISILFALICMYLCGFSLNLVTLSALVLGVGMMVDNSIVTLEACFRAKAELNKNGVDESIGTYVKTTLLATKNIGGSIFGGTITTCVVFAPLAFMAGLAGQFFKPLGSTIVFCMLASLISALTIVPLCYVFLHPEEKTEAPLTNAIKKIQETYRNFVPKTLQHKKLTLVVFLGIAFLIIPLIRGLKAELVPATDEGMIKVSIKTKPALLLENKNEIFKSIEKFVMDDVNVEHYLLASDAGGAMSQTASNEMTLIAFLKENRKIKTKKLASTWKRKLSNIADCTIDAQSYSSSSSSSYSSNDSEYSVVIESSDYDDLKVVDRKILDALRHREELIGVHSSLESNAPLIKIKVDPILAAAEGLSPIGVGSTIYEMISGKEVMEKNINNETLTVLLEYPENYYKTISDIEQIVLTTPMGSSVLLRDIATITYEDSAKSISKVEKKYRGTFKASYADGYNKKEDKVLLNEVIKPNLTQDVTLGSGSYDRMLKEELVGLGYSLAVAVFLVFVVMAMQFESVLYSIMVMSTVFFSFVGSIFALWICNASLSIPALLGVMMLIGTAVNNGILYVDTVNQLKKNMPLNKTLVEAGAIRYRPILMTTLTTIIAEIPMAMAYGDSGEMLQGLALVNVGGLVISTIVALYLLPALYLLFYGTHRKSFYDGMQDTVETAWVEINQMQLNSNEVQ